MPKKVLVVAAGWLGDNIMLGSLLRTLQQQGHHITILNTHAHFVGLFSRIVGVDAIIDFPLPKKNLSLQKRLQCAALLRPQQFDEIIYAPNTIKAALIGFFARIPRRTGWHGEARYILLNQRHTHKSRCHTMVQTYVQLAYPVHSPIIPVNQCPEPRILAHDMGSIDPHTRPVMLCPGAAAGESKRWPIEHYIALSKRLLDAGYAVHLLGGPGEVQLGARIQADTGYRCIDWTGKTTLTAVIDIMQQAHCVVANDSGLMHMAAALSVPVMAIYGATPPDFAPPLSKQGRAFSMHVPCRPCGKNHCPLNTLACLHGVTVESIFTAITQLPSSPPEKLVKST